MQLSLRYGLEITEFVSRIGYHFQGNDQLANFNLPPTQFNNKESVDLGIFWKKSHSSIGRGFGS